MRYLTAADDATDVTLSVTQNLEPLLSGRALALYRALHTSAVEVGAAREYHPNTSQVSFFCPVEAVALALGVHRSTVYRALAELRAVGLVDQRGHYTTHRGRTRSDGAVWAVRLSPVKGCRARLGYDDLKKQYRDLGGDIAAGRTCWADMERSKEQPSSEGVNLHYIRQWSINPLPTKPTIGTLDRSKTARRDLEALLDVQHAPREARGAAVDLAAQALATALSDRAGVNFYRRLVWQLLRRSDATGEDHSYSVYLAAQRAAVDASEGFARRPGALFVSRLKGAPWWDEVMRGPPVRVGLGNSTPAGG
jgi:DNA-binding transcriptional ArsR family regulator